MSSFWLEARLLQLTDLRASRWTRYPLLARKRQIQRLVSGLAPFQPYLRGAPPGLPFCWDVETVQRGLNFTLTTTSGAIDLLGEIAGGGSYSQLLKDTLVIRVFGIECRCLSLERLIHVKRAAGRPKDLEAIAELEAILEERSAKGEA